MKPDKCGWNEDERCIFHAYHKNKLCLYVEFYDTGEIGYIISDNKKTIANEDITIDKVSGVIIGFLEGLYE